MDLELARKYKEYTDLVEKITPLRTEYGFLVSDIPTKQKELESITKSITDSKLQFNIEKEQREIENNKEREAISASKVAWDSEKDRQKKLLVEEVEQLSNQKIELIEFNKKQNAIHSEISNKIGIWESKLLEIEKIELESKWKYELKLKEVEAKEKTLAESIADHNKRMSALEKREVVVDAKEKNYLAIKDHVEAKGKEQWEKELEQDKREKELSSREKETDKKLATIIEKEDNAKEMLNSNKEALHQLTEKELTINKRISEFQDEKFQFLVLMKQKWIKKADIDQLEKEFTL